MNSPLLYFAEMENESIYTLKGNTFVPFRKLFEYLGANVEWNEETQTAIGYADKIKIELFINKNYAIVNGKTVRLDAAPFIMKGNTMVPLRFVSKTLGAKVDWNQTTSTVIITTKD